MLQRSLGRLQPCSDLPAAQRRGEPAFSRRFTTARLCQGHAQTSPVVGWAWPVAEGLPLPTRSHETPLRAAQNPSGLHCGTCNLFTVASQKWRHDTCGQLSPPLPPDQHLGRQRLLHPCSWFLRMRDGAAEQERQTRSGGELREHRAEMAKATGATLALPSTPSLNILVFPTPRTLSAVHYLLHSVYYCAF